jgi:4-hydroxy-4-methyl-2-oxoglutarate aldolase
MRRKVLPASIWREVIEQALEKARGENMVREELLNGMKLKEVFTKYGIL